MLNIKVVKVKFHSAGERNELSNFHPCEFVWKDTKFNCSEQAFQWAKAKTFNDSEIADKILAETSPKKMKYLGKKVKNFDDKVWDKYKVAVMKSIVSAKFSQNKDLTEILLSTKDLYLEEYTSDKFWGSGRNGTGKNILGQILMQYRNNIIGGLND